MSPCSAQAISLFAVHGYILVPSPCLQDWCTLGLGFDLFSFQLLHITRSNGCFLLVISPLCEGWYWTHTGCLGPGFSSFVHLSSFSFNPYNFIPPPLLLLFLPLFASPPRASLAALPALHRPSFSNQMKLQDYLSPSLLGSILFPLQPRGKPGRSASSRQREPHLPVSCLWCSLTIPPPSHYHMLTLVSTASDGSRRGNLNSFGFCSPQISEHLFLNTLQVTCAGKLDVQSLSRGKVRTTEAMYCPFSRLL